MYNLCLAELLYTHCDTMSGWITLYTQVVRISTPSSITMYTLCLAELQCKHLCQDGLQRTHYVRKAYIVHSHTRNPSQVPLVVLRWRKGFTVCSMAVCIAALPLVFILSRLIKNKSFCNFVVDACLLYTSPSPRDISGSRMPSSA